ncbi:hypothetical protein RchiOBHm_Chr7g0223041 [Rosa chinensis]|uniref:Uncharacterized protein n=1 Tax=Rosa chinensis TaxID=74649 RepID=A0A2P6PDG7_ROSCH|nr:hypothetical protein RchiOBHm_Chr7g0223041 [Rosa chinensis]
MWRLMQVNSIGTRPFMNDPMFQRWKLQQPSVLRLRSFLNDHICLNAGADHHEGPCISRWVERASTKEGRLFMNSLSFVDNKLSGRYISLPKKTRIA